MAELKMNVAIVPLNGANYPTWKVQSRMRIFICHFIAIICNVPQFCLSREAFLFKVARNADWKYCYYVCNQYFMVLCHNVVLWCRHCFSCRWNANVSRKHRELLLICWKGQKTVDSWCLMIEAIFQCDCRHPEQVQFLLPHEFCPLFQLWVKVH